MSQESTVRKVAGSAQPAPTRDTLKKVGIMGLGTAIPEKVLTNKDLEKIVDTSDEWIRTRTGIKERRIMAEGTGTSSLAAEASRQALKDAGISPEEIDLVLVGTVTPDMAFPSTACLVQAELGIPTTAMAFDLAAACSGFVFALHAAAQFVATGACRNALVIGADALSQLVDWEDRTTCVLFGDGAGACVIGPAESGGILSAVMGSDGSASDLLKVPGGGSLFPKTKENIDSKEHFIKMNGTEVFKMAVRNMVDAAKKALEQSGHTIEDIKRLVPHQANLRILKAVAKGLGMPEERVFVNVDRYGNMSAASTVVAWAEAVRAGDLKKGDLALLLAFGGGMVWGAMVVEM
ncbi:MAG: ketoacyl-ACP synthase III [Candidatus Omnitrophica bacterium]|nr:ketoacyl-ACP synthase III [Candidatus Omnitrophota bacterium]